jgi:hypothetical protein
LVARQDRANGAAHLLADEEVVVLGLGERGAVLPLLLVGTLVGLAGAQHGADVLGLGGALGEVFLIGLAVVLGLSLDDGRLRLSRLGRSVVAVGVGRLGRRLGGLLELGVGRAPVLVLELALALIAAPALVLLLVRVALRGLSNASIA